MKLPRFIFGTSTLGNLYEEKTYAQKLEIVRTIITTATNNIESKQQQQQQDLRSSNNIIPDENLEKPLIMFDSAGKYGAGLALETLGQILNDLQVPPENILISNKLGWERVPLTASGVPTFESDIWINLHHDASQSIGYDGILRCYHQGNELLGGQYTASLVSVHDPDEYCLIPDTTTTTTATTTPISSKEQDTSILMDSRRRDILRAYEALSELKRTNKVQSVGVSTKDYRIIEWLMNEENSRLVHLDWAMISCSFTIHTHSPDVVSLIKRLNTNGIAVINSAIFNSGFLLGTDYYNYVKIARETHPDLYTWRDQFFQVCDEYSLTPLTACLHFNFIHTNIHITSIAINPSSPEQVLEYYDSLRVKVPQAFWDRLRTLHLINI